MNLTQAYCLYHAKKWAQESEFNRDIHKVFQKYEPKIIDNIYMNNAVLDFLKKEDL